MCICFTLGQQDNYKCCLACNYGLGNAVVTVKATKHEFQAPCWHLTSWIHAGARKWKIFDKSWWMLFCPCSIGSGLCLGLNLTWEWFLKVCPGTRRFGFPTLLWARVYVCSPRILTVSLGGGGSCLFSPASGFSWTPKALMGPSIWDRCWLDLGQVAHSIFRNWGRAVLMGGTQRWSRLLCWRKESPLDHKSTSLLLIYPEPIVTGLAILANPFLPIVLKTKVIMKIYR